MGKEFYFNTSDYIQIEYDTDILECVFRDNINYINIFLDDIYTEIGSILKKDIEILDELKRSIKWEYIDVDRYERNKEKYEYLKKKIIKKIEMINQKKIKNIVKKYFNIDYINNDIQYILDVFNFDKKFINSIKKIILTKVTSSIHKVSLIEDNFNINV